MSENRYHLTDEQAHTLAGLFTGKLDICDGCQDTVPVDTLVTVGIADGGGPRRFCPTCRSEERNWALTPEEACEQCGTIRKKLGSRCCSAACEEKLAKLANQKRCQAHDRQGETFCIDCGLVLCLQCCSYYGRCMGCNIKATAPIFVVSDNK